LAKVEQDYWPFYVCTAVQSSITDGYICRYAAVQKIYYCWSRYT